MVSSKKYLKHAGLSLFLLGPAFLLWFFSKANHNFKPLPIYGPKYEITAGDTAYHSVPEFRFTNQNGERFGSRELEGKLYVLNFIFTTCPSICPKMSGQMSRLQLKLHNSAFNDIHFVSITVDPENDTPSVLLDYADNRSFDLTRWNFLTGLKKDIYSLGVDGFFLAAREDVMAEGGFLHSEKIALVDWEGKIRGYCDGTSTDEVNDLADEVKVLMREHKVYLKKNGK
jgi:protein SCO1/2